MRERLGQAIFLTPDFLTQKKLLLLDWPRLSSQARARFEIPLQRCQRREKKFFHRPGGVGVDLEFETAPRARAKARAGSKVACMPQTEKGEIPLVFFSNFPPKSPAPVALLEHSPTWGRAACPCLRRLQREEGTSFSRGAWLSFLLSFFLGERENYS